MSFEHLFSTSDLSVVTPDTSLEFPPAQPSPEWLSHLSSNSIDRKQAFFDEQLQFIAVLKIEHPEPDTPADEAHPPEALLSFLAHIQITLEATYISPIPVQPPEAPNTARLLSAPPRTGSLALTPASRTHQHHPPIFPPATPNPTPAATDNDRKYVQSEGTPLLAGIWGQNNAPDSMEKFALLWSEGDKVWVAVYRMALTVSFLRLNFLDPLLCLTVSATLRDKPVITPATQNSLAQFLTSVGSHIVAQPESPATPDGAAKDGEDDELLEHLEEVNLLEGLFSGPTFSNMGSEKINFPSTRLGTVSRQKLFGLPPVSIPTPTAPSPSPMTAVRKAHPTLRKSFRKTLQTVSGFRVRMRTVFVPYVLLPTEEGDQERDRREAGTEERTVVLCVEVENSGEAGSKVGFMVEKVDVNIGGEGAKTTLIGWGDAGLSASPEKSTFPLKVTPLAQVNLLYAVTFVRSPEELDAFSYAKRRSLTAPGGPGLASELQKAVAINVFGKPYAISFDIDSEEDGTEGGEESEEEMDSEHAEDYAYPTDTFSSRWNCVLDLTVHSVNPPPDDLESEPPSALPEPPSPFPTYALRSAAAKNISPGTSVLFSATSLSSPPLTSIADGRRHTLPTPIAGLPARSLKSITPNRASLPFMLPPSEGGSPRGTSPSPSGASPSGRMSTYPPPSALREYLRSPTTYAAPPPPPQSPPPNQYDPPMTPAYPAFPSRSELPPTPMSQGPVAQGQGSVGPSVEIRRERGAGMRPGPPPTPGPSVPASHFASQQVQGTRTPIRETKDLAESIVISVGLLDEDLDEDEKHKGKIYPQDVFTLDIFVFNQSTWIRRFEITCPSGRKRGKGGPVYGPLGGVVAKHGKAAPEYPGVMPLDGRVRIGPLRPSSPGVHSIEALTLTDIETGYSMNLCSVMDVVVHDPND
ncbi:hypothetical protein BDQ17DRAFT_1387346 [Cyathus striatus]|nr:hypothetical protein BDQ17DRAFT_1387346 [Cyathus striatus]